MHHTPLIRFHTPGDFLDNLRGIIHSQRLEIVALGFAFAENDNLF